MGRDSIWILFICLLFPLPSFGHGSYNEHVNDIVEVLGFNSDGRKSYKNAMIKNEWLKFISSDMIDNSEFHKTLCTNHKGFPDLSTPRRHRILFHWGYDAEPWNRELERIVIQYCEDYDLNIESNLRVFKSEIKSEQKRRNSKIDEKTQQIFGFASGGKDRELAHFFSSIAYNIHILGDYTSDNTILVGLHDFQDLVGLIIDEIRKLDSTECKPIIKGINLIVYSKKNIQYKADELMAYLKKHMPNFIKNARNGSLYRRLKDKQHILFND